MTWTSKALVGLGLLLPLLAKADGDLIVKSGGSVTVKSGASIIVGPNRIMDVQSGGRATIEKNGTMDGNVTVRSGGLLILCGEITGDLLSMGRIGNCDFRTDAMIGKKRKRLGGDNRYSKTGAGSPLSLSLGAGKVNFFIAGQNDAFVEDGLRFRAGITNGGPRLSINRITGGRSNVTAQFARSAYVDPQVAPGETILFLVSAKAGKRSSQEKIFRFTADVFSTGDGGVSDRVAAEIEPLESEPERPQASDRGR